MHDKQVDDSGRWKKAATWALGSVMATLPLSAAATAIHMPGGEHIEIAGQDMVVRPEIGRDVTNLDGFATLSTHKHIPIIDLNIGASVNPTHIGAIDPSDPSIINAVRQIAGDPEPHRQHVQEAATRFIIERGAEGGIPVAAAELAGVLLYRRQRRKYEQLGDEAASIVRTQNRDLRRAGAATIALASVALTFNGARILSHDEHIPVHPSAQLERIGATGIELGPLAEKLMPIVMTFLPYTKEFYDELAKQAGQAVHDNPDLSKEPADGIVRLGFVDDFQNVNGMARTTAGSFRQGHVDHAFVLGDWTDLGTPYETSIFDSFTYNLGKEIPATTTAGLHDTDEILHTAAGRGITVADDTTKDMDGVKVLSLNDPRVSMIGSGYQGWKLRDKDVDVESFIQQSAAEICLSNPDIVANHASDLAEQLMQAADAAGCPIKLLLNGRSYEFIGPTYHQNVATGTTTTEITLGSGGGHIDTSANPGVIEGPATALFLDIDTAADTYRYYVETAQTDDSVTITPPISVSVPYAEYLQTGETGVDVATPANDLNKKSAADDTATQADGPIVQHR
jgi:hypothetical protein